MRFVFDDGGRADAGYKGRCGDCAVRAIAIATGKPYREVYDALFALNRRYTTMVGTDRSPRNGNTRTKDIREYMKSIGWRWVPTMQIGGGCNVHLKDGELPMGRVVARVSKHLVAVIDGVIHDTHDCSRDGTRCVYGYFVQG